MKHARNPGLLDRLRAESRAFLWKQALVRMGADFLLVNAAMVLAFVSWLLFYVVVLEIPRPSDLVSKFRNFVKSYWIFWSCLALLVFHLHGFYTRARGYTRRYKNWIIFRASSLFIVSFVFADYFILRSELIPRGVAVLGWVFTLAAVGGTRLARDFVVMQYRIEPKHRPKTIERVLVVGGAGYLGAHIVPQLLERGYRARVLDLFMFGEEPLAAVKNHPRCELMRGDVRDITATVRAMQRCDAVIDLAAIVGDPACEENKPLATEINRAATRMLLDIARGYGAKRFLFASTCSVYGASDLLVDERSAIAPLSTYAHTKLDSEAILLEAAGLDFHPTVFRLGTLFGLSPRMRFDLVVNLLVMRAITERRIAIFNGCQWRPFMHVRDAARAFVDCLGAKPESVSGELFNLGDDRLNHQLSEIGETLERIVPGVAVEHVNNSDARNYRVSFEKIRTRLGFSCRTTLEEGMQEICEAIGAGHIRDFATPRFNNLAGIRAFSAAAGAAPSPLGRLVALAGGGKPNPAAS